MRGLAATLQLLEKTAEIIGGVTLALVVGLTVADVVGRYFFNAPLGGATELTEFGVAVVVFSALPAVTWNQGHVAVDLLDKWTPLWLRHWRALAIDVIFAVCLAVLGKRIGEIALRADRREEVSEYLALPMAWIYGYIALICGLVALGLLAKAWRHAGVATALSPVQSSQ